jgi:predicted nucleic acid-binding Zn ribbon protein
MKSDIRNFSQLCTEWRRVVGAQIAAVSRPAALANTGVLYVCVSTSSWRSELEQVSGDVLAALPSTLGGMPVRRVRWVRAV